MKEKIFSVSAILLALAFLSSSAYSWNFATHAYIANKIGRFLPLGNANEMYGCMLPDFLNLRFDLWTDYVLRGYTHGVPPGHPYFPPSNDFMSVWYHANSPLKKSIAFGYAAHNDVWGADFIAHWNADPFNMKPGDQPGFIIMMAEALMGGIDWTPLEALLEMTLPDSAKLEFCHNIVEYAGDLLIKQVDPMIGRKLVFAALFRTPETMNLLKAAYPVAYDDEIETGEPEFRNQMIQYGLILLQPQDVIIGIFADQMAQLTIDYVLALYNKDISAYKELLIPFCQEAISVSVGICQAFGYMNEVNMTIRWVRKQLLAQGVFYW